MNSVCYVTAFLDLNRGDWPIFKRTFEDYLVSFKVFLKIFEASTCGNDEMICFIDENRFKEVESLFPKDVTVNITLIKLTKNMLEDLHCWKTLNTEQENMNNEDFKKLVRKRFGFPETIYASYTCINHCKIDFVAKVIDSHLSDKEYFCWIDFGYFMKIINIPEKLLDISHFDTNKFNCWLVNPIDNMDSNYKYLLSDAPEKIQGNSWFGRKDIIKKYQEIYYEVLDWYQNHLKVADDDQAIMLISYFKHPELFEFNKINYGWHKMMICYQKKKYEKKHIDFAYVSFVNDNATYINLMKTTIDSVMKFSAHKFILYCVNFNGNIVFRKYPNLIIRNITNVSLSSIYYFKPYVIIDSIQSGLQHGYYIESDDVITPYCDSVYEIAKTLTNLPISPIHPDEHLIPADDMKFLNITNKTQGYIHAHVVFKHSNINFIKEWFENCLKKNNYRNADETVLNCMYWKYKCENHFLGSPLIPCDPYYYQFYERPFLRDVNHVYSFHGCKDPILQEKLFKDMSDYYK